MRKMNLKGLLSPFTPDRNTRGDIGVGLAITGFAMVGIFIISLVSGLIEVESIGFDLKTFAFYTGLTWFAAGYEELIYRIILLSVLIKFLKRPWLAVVLTSVVFGWMHATNDHATLLSVISNGLGGVMYGIAFVGTRKIWLPWALHFAWNYVQATILGFPLSGFEVDGILNLNLLDNTWLSGGLYGPEGGIVGITFRFVVIGLIILWIKKSRGSIYQMINQSTSSQNLA
ncbi:CPBP family intramembrane glutamic endopeptidase [Cytobacillus sp. FJAT-54145]|uniref:CPBP family intramembrane glutamic endopeptidase n=1 Tax=Cytobacillus spartinae TaxID=3299023 RepID=A0ABW6KF52_9BACI